MEIGRTPGQLDAFEEIRAEHALIKRRAMRWRTVVGLGMGVFLGLGFGYQGRNALRSQPDHLDAGVVASATPDYLRARYLAEHAGDAELVADFELFFTAQRRSPDALSLLLGVQRLAGMVVDEVRALPLPQRAAVAQHVLDAMKAGLCATDDELLALAPTLRRYAR